MDFHLEDIRPRYRFCRVGFGLLALALGLLCVAKVSLVALLFGAHREVLALYQHPAWLWLVDAPITWGSLLGTYLLLGRWSEPTWQRKVGLLLLMNAVDAGMWTVDHAHLFGFKPSGLELGWTFFVVASGQGWFELILAAALAADVSAHLGHEEAVESGHAAHTLGLIGAIIWGILALTQTDWGTWPLQPQITPEFQVLRLISTVLMILLTFQVTALCLTASRLCAGYLKELDCREWDNDLLKSRSETEGDDISWRD